MDTLVLVTARGGSKGIPGKNVKPLYGKPMILYTLEVAMKIFPGADICVSTDDQRVIDITRSVGLPVPFVRPAELATDTANSRDVILHALQFYSSVDKNYDRVLLLQPTSPFRKADDLTKMLALYNPTLDMVVSVREAKDNPYYSIYEETRAGFLTPSKKNDFTRRQDCPKVFAYNGSAYVINADSLRNKPLSDFSRVVKYEMEEIFSIDIDTPFDWLVAEMILEKGLIKV